MSRDSIGPQAILNKKRQFLLPCLYHFYQDPPQIVRGRGQYLFDDRGRRYIDCFAGVSVLNVGHSHPEVVDAVRAQVGELAHTTSIYLTQPMVDLAERLAGWVPGPLRRSFFCASGSEANEGAALLAQIYTGRHEFLALDRSLHGRTKLGMSLTGLGMWRTDGSPVGGVHHVPTPYCYRCPLKLRFPQCGLACADEVENAIKLRTSGRVAGLFIEPVLANGGMIVLPPGYLERVREILARYEILLIVDEVQTGFCRTGKRFAFQHSEVIPDVLSLAKSLGGGLPIAAFMTRNELADSFTRPSASTFGGNLVSCAAALAVLAILEREQLEVRSHSLGEHLAQRLFDLQQRYRSLGDVRGLGLMQGVELVTRQGHAATELADRVLEHLKDSGVLTGRCGVDRNVLAFQPPLVIEPKDLDDVADRLDAALQAAGAK